MSMNKTWAISSWISFLTSADMFRASHIYVRHYPIVTPGASSTNANWPRRFPNQPGDLEPALSEVEQINRVHEAPLPPRRQVNRRDHAARAPATKLNRREFKRHEPRVVRQRFALFLGQCSSGAAGKHQQFLSTSIV